MFFSTERPTRNYVKDDKVLAKARALKEPTDSEKEKEAAKLKSLGGEALVGRKVFFRKCGKHYRGAIKKVCLADGRVLVEVEPTHIGIGTWASKIEL